MDWEFIGNATGKLLDNSGTVVPGKDEVFKLFVKVIAGKVFFATTDGYSNHINIAVLASSNKFTHGRVRIDGKTYSIPLPTID
ncbi:MAG: hypothetical protein IKW85_11200 [Muribaculaceae bacterium]|nr:hypothetical protein [Muribaculaceae bacterium]